MIDIIFNFIRDLPVPVFVKNILAGLVIIIPMFMCGAVFAFLLVHFYYIILPLMIILILLMLAALLGSTFLD